MNREITSTDQAPAAVGPYSQGVRVGDFVFTAGQLGIVPGTKKFAGAEIESQTRQALENVKAVLEASGSCMQHVVQCRSQHCHWVEVLRSKQSQWRAAAIPTER